MIQNLRALISVTFIWSHQWTAQNTSKSKLTTYPKNLSKSIIYFQWYIKVGCTSKSYGDAMAYHKADAWQMISFAHASKKQANSKRRLHQDYGNIPGGPSNFVSLSMILGLSTSVGVMRNISEKYSNNTTKSQKIGKAKKSQVST